MRAATGLLVMVVLLWAVGAAALPVRIECTLSYAGFGHVNGLIEEFAELNGSELSTLHVALGGGVSVGSITVLGPGSIVAGLRGGFAARSWREAEVSASVLGVCAGYEYVTGRFAGILDVGIYRGSFDFSEARYVRLAGWGPGIRVAADYKVLSRESLDLYIAASVQWLPVQAMSDPSGQTFRGRGTPFLDFSGISLSMGVEWRF